MNWPAQYAADPIGAREPVVGKYKFANPPASAVGYASDASAGTCLSSSSLVAASIRPRRDTSFAPRVVQEMFCIQTVQGVVSSGKEAGQQPLNVSWHTVANSAESLSAFPGHSVAVMLVRYQLHGIR